MNPTRALGFSSSTELSETDLSTAVAFAEAWPDRTQATYAGVGFPIIGIQALMKNKRVPGRPKDLVDLELLRRHHPQGR